LVQEEGEPVPVLKQVGDRLAQTGVRLHFLVLELGLQSVPT